MKLAKSPQILKVILKILYWVSKGEVEGFYYIYALETNLGSSVDEVKR